MKELRRRMLFLGLLGLALLAAALGLAILNFTLMLTWPSRAWRFFFGVMFLWNATQVVRTARLVHECFEEAAS